MANNFFWKLLMIDNMKVLCWNCRGAKSSVFIMNLKEIMRPYNPTVIAVVDPRIHGVAVDGVCMKSYY